ncbi:N-acetylmuramoyl-L-alanine amidase [Salegentibacter sp. F188]|uniref:N-acetylmuramoyl-L-alanine amidase n=1 Tax=Autumnicola patrickiae TaxID=3075591 RepID=A0ABU3E3C3_9FLAO|nr:N-acetylmuramoyl-L-alanine amidase [Salegentibacter sp. F188]MDT0690435.1 N-acetylmuramoyl-L-alanine amidase [Salegentibacter sp. F188]
MKSISTLYRLTLFLPVLLLLNSCATNPYSKTNRVYKKQTKTFAKELQISPEEEIAKNPDIKYGEHWVGTTNFNLRRPNYVILHHTAQDSVEQTLNTFITPERQVSAHYVIGHNGEVYHMLNDYYRAWHGGIGSWGTTTDLNSASIGIELDNDGFEEFSDAQIESLIEVLKMLREKYKIPAKNVIGHSDIAPSRKVDPSVFFPWKKLAEEGFGIWYNEEVIDNLQLESQFFNYDKQLLIMKLNPLGRKLTFLDRLLFPNIIPSDFNYKDALKIIGYDTSNLSSAIQAFELHFIQKDVNGILSDYDLKILYDVYRKSF